MTVPPTTKLWFAPAGVWANYPYLHNDSVPTLHLLGPVVERPRIFSVKAAGAFDPRRVGQRCPRTAGAVERITTPGTVRRRPRLVQREPAGVWQRGPR